MDLKEFVEPRGVAAKLARSLGVTPVLISQWAAGSRPVPEDRAPSIEFETDFQVRVETLCPDTRWQRVVDRSWPYGKPLIDKTPKSGHAPLVAPLIAPPLSKPLSESA